MYRPLTMTICALWLGASLLWGVPAQAAPRPFVPGSQRPEWPTIQARCDHMGVFAEQIVQKRDAGAPWGLVEDSLAAMGEWQRLPALIKKDYLDFAAWLYVRPYVGRAQAKSEAQQRCHWVWAQRLGWPEPGTLPPAAAPSRAMQQVAETIRREVYGPCGEDVYMRYIKTEDSVENRRRFPFRIKQYHGLTMRVYPLPISPAEQAAGVTEQVEVAFYVSRQREWLPSDSGGWRGWEGTLGPDISEYTVWLKRQGGRILRELDSGRKGTAVACADVPQ